MADTPHIRELKRQLHTLPKSAWAKKFELQQEITRLEAQSKKQQDLYAARQRTRTHQVSGHSTVAVLEREGVIDAKRELFAFGQPQVDPLAEKVGNVERLLGLREYQAVGIHFLARNWQRSQRTGKMPYPGQILGDDPGLGKTVQFFGTMLVCEEIRTVIYLTNKGLILEVCDELRDKWASKVTDRAFLFMPIVNKPGVDDKQVSMTLQLSEYHPGQRVIVTNYEALNSFPSLSRYKWDLLVADESHRLRGGAQQNQTQVWKNVKDLVWANSHGGVIAPEDKDGVETLDPVRNVDRCLFMTGSLINNSPVEIWAPLNIFDPVRFDDPSLFRNLFKAIKKAHDAGHHALLMGEVLKMLAPCMIRRQLSDVAAQLPEVTYIDHKCEMTPEQAQVYRAARDDIKLIALKMDDEAFMRNQLELYGRLRQIAIYPGHIDVKMWHYADGIKLNTWDWLSVDFEGNGKLKAVVDQIELKLLEGEQVLVASSQYTDPVEWLFGYFRDLERKMPEGYVSSALITGETPVDERKQIVRDFQQGKTRVIFCTSKAAGTGLNLQKSSDWPGGASHVMLIDEHFNPEVDKQMLGRILRINTNAPVFVHRFVLSGPDGPDTTSIDHVVRVIQNEKVWWIDNVTNHRGFKITSKRDLLNML